MGASRESEATFRRLVRNAIAKPLTSAGAEKCRGWSWVLTIGAVEKRVELHRDNRSQRGAIDFQIFVWDESDPRVTFTDLGSPKWFTMYRYVPRGHASDRALTWWHVEGEDVCRFDEVMGLGGSKPDDGYLELVVSKVLIPTLLIERPSRVPTLTPEMMRRKALLQEWREEHAGRRAADEP